MKPIYSLFIMLSFAGQLRAQNDTTELFPYGDMNQWMVRVVDESLVIGGNTKYLYEITPGDTLKTTPLIRIVYLRGLRRPSWLKSAEW